MIPPELRAREESFFGETASRTLREYAIDTLFFSCQGLERDSGLYAGTQAHAALLKQMLLAARQTVALVDGSKLGRTGVARIGGLGELDCLVIAQWTALVQSIFFLGYFFVALPAAALIKRFSYKAAIIIGLCLYALGCFLFVPAAQIMTYGAFLACLGVIACGLSFLETSANTYSSLLGPIQSSTQRINFSQIFNSLGVISGVLIGQLMVFGENDPSHEQLLAMPAAAADVARHQMVGQVVGPYLIIGSVLVVLALVFVFIKFPSCKGAPAQQQQLPTER